MVGIIIIILITAIVGSDLIIDVLTAKSSR